MRKKQSCSCSTCPSMSNMPLHFRLAHNTTTLHNRLFSFIFSSIWNAIKKCVMYAPSLSAFISCLKVNVIHSIYNSFACSNAYLCMHEMWIAYVPVFLQTLNIYFAFYVSFYSSGFKCLMLFDSICFAMTLLHIRNYISLSIIATVFLFFSIWHNWSSYPCTPSPYWLWIYWCCPSMVFILSDWSYTLRLSM